jgi:hypothetical protein
VERAEARVMPPELDAAAMVANGLEIRRKNIGQDATLMDAAREWHSDMSASFETTWRGSGNPIWVWRGLARLASLCVYASAVCPELRGRRFIEDVPQWCAEYLIDAAYRVEQLAAGRDFRSRDLTPRFHFVDGHLSPEQARDLIPSALSFVRPGWSAFREYRDDDLSRLFLENQEIAPEVFSFEKLMGEMGWVDERNARRKLAKIRKGAKPRG